MTVSEQVMHAADRRLDSSLGPLLEMTEAVDGQGHSREENPMNLGEQLRRVRHR